MKRTFNISPAAAEDLRHIVSFLHKESPRSARLVLERVNRAMALIEHFPLMGVMTEQYPAVRKHPVPRTRLALFYLVDDERLMLLRVLHMSQGSA